MKNKLILIGGGGHCKSCIDVIEQANQYEILGVLDMPKKVGQEVLSYKVVGTDESINQLVQKDCHFLITVGHIGTSMIRKKIYARLKECNANIATVISPMAYVSRHAKIEEGTIVMHNALVNASAHVGRNCIINSKALIEHDVFIEDHCHISTSAVVNGGALIKAGTFFGSNAVSKEGSVSKKDAFIKAGSTFLGETGG